MHQLSSPQQPSQTSTNPASSIFIHSIMLSLFNVAFDSALCTNLCLFTIVTILFITIHLYVMYELTTRYPPPPYMRHSSLRFVLAHRPGDESPGCFMWFGILSVCGILESKVTKRYFLGFPPPCVSVGVSHSAVRGETHRYRIVVAQWILVAWTRHPPPRGTLSSESSISVSVRLAAVEGFFGVLSVRNLLFGGQFLLFFVFSLHVICGFSCGIPSKPLWNQRDCSFFAIAAVSVFSIKLGTVLLKYKHTNCGFSQAAPTCNKLSCPAMKVWNRVKYISFT